MSMVFKDFINYIKYIFLCVSYNVRSSFSNKKSFIIQAVSMFINNFVFILFWIVLFNNKGGSVNGIVLNDILYLWSIPVMGFGIASFCFGGSETLCKDIVEGNIDIYLTKPKHSLISQLTSGSVLSAMGDFIFGVVCGLIAVSFNPLSFLVIILLSLISAIIFVSVMTSFCLLTFWLGDLSSSTNVYNHTLLITLTIYPEQMFKKVIKVLMYTVIPAMYIAHIPVRLIKGFSINWFIILILSAIFFVSLMFVLYKQGLKKYESGNGVTRR